MWEGNYTTAADSFSFGMVFYEILTSKIPYEDAQPYEVISIVIGGKRPNLPENLPKTLVNLIDQCWAHDPQARPTFPQICEILNQFNSRLCTLSANFRDKSASM